MGFFEDSIPLVLDATMSEQKVIIKEADGNVKEIYIIHVEF